ncbi:glycosyltransferase family 4 protein [Rhizobium sp. B230/85]|uniref:glycosyltransferase family 4 protein n=2 Tax=Rhizobium TaxID=379 RepID=UPI001B1ED2D4|nr:glycosyltransferase family 4 protein [Rhizobium sp. B230/85]MBO9136772.1 glycosyltransferase family 4 protein [Rhizobium sp. B209b/85]QXZ99083.1 glycosyltransferase family 4 protein [Rhizobium sp. B230/85]
MKKLSFSKAPLIAWTFNMGQTYGGLRGSIARFALSSVDLFVVHTTAEIEAYSSWLRLPKSRFVFVPLGISVPTGEVDSLETQEPFVLSMGSANRDYDCLFRAVGELGYRTIVVAGEHSTEGLDIPKNVDLRSGLSLNQCHALSRAARVNVVPIKDEDSPSGQVTFLETMIFGKAMVLTECAGTRDYVTSGENGVLVAPNTTSEMRDAIFMLWNDRELRNRIGDAAKRRVLDQSTLEGIAPTMLRLLQRF